jgi:dienelactone hydrolase
MNTKNIYFLVIAVALLFTKTSAQQTAKLTSSGIGYLEYLPQGYKDNTNRYPVVISLHGIKEKGNSLSDVSRVANVGLPKYVKYGQQYPFILISPQLKTSMARWTGSYVMQVLDHIKKKLRIDETRIYLTGLSLGGGGVWSVISANPETFAAILPVCSGYNTLSAAADIAREDVPVWAFHGDKDGTVSYTVTQKMINALNGTSPKPSPLAKFTIFPGMSHIIWDKVYKQTTALEWMLGFRNGSSFPGENKSPVVSAGGDKRLTLPTNATSLQGSANDADGSIASYSWKKLSGGTLVMSGTSSAKLNLSGLKEGTYNFRLTVKDNKGSTKYDDVKVIVDASGTNKLPVANAGSDKTTTNQGLTVVGRGSDPDGYITSYKWTKLSGPNVPMSNTTTSKLWVSKLVNGIYYFRLTVTDNKGGTHHDDMKLVMTPGNIAPQVSAGADQRTSNRGITLVGRASDSDGYITSWHWKKLSGPAVPLDHTNSQKLWVSKLVPGTYYFRLSVKDNNGTVRSDDVKLVVSSS